MNQLQLNMSIDFERLGVGLRDTVDLLIQLHADYEVEGFSKLVGRGAGTVYYLGDFASLTDYLSDLLETITVYGLRGIAFHRLLDSGDLETHLVNYGGIGYDLINIDKLTTEEVASW